MGTKQIKILAMALFMIFLPALLPLSARASSIQLTLSPVLGTPGSTLTVYGTITNTGSGTIYLNSEDFTLPSSSFLNGDTTNFFLNAPLFLSGGTNSGLIALLAFDVAPGTSVGLYPGNFIDIFGGPGSTDQNLLATAQFSVTVAPEPGTLLLLGTGLIPVAALLRRRLGTTA
jgi:hypothetical protein